MWGRILLIIIIVYTIYPSVIISPKVSRPVIIVASSTLILVIVVKPIIVIAIGIVVTPLLRITSAPSIASKIRVPIVLEISRIILPLKTLIVVAIS